MCERKKTWLTLATRQDKLGATSNDFSHTILFMTQGRIATQQTMQKFKNLSHLHPVYSVMCIYLACGFIKNSINVTVITCHTVIGV